MASCRGEGGFNGRGAGGSVTAAGKVRAGPVDTTEGAALSRIAEEDGCGADAVWPHGF